MIRVAALAGFLALSHSAFADAPAPVGTKIAEFTATEVASGKAWSLTDQGREAKAIAVVFLGTECPISNQYVPVLMKLQRDFAKKGVQVVGINSVPQDDLAAVASHAKNFELGFPILKDADQKVADKFKVARVPEAFVLDGTRTVRYRGRIDDQFGRGVSRVAASKTDLADALKAVLDGKDVKSPMPEAVGCPLSRPDREPKAGSGVLVTYSKDVAPLFQKHCQECHRPGEIGPFSLLNYKQAKAWSDAIKEAIADSRMPPWHADPAHGSFANERKLSDGEKKTIFTWIDQGCQKGDDKDLPPARTFTEGWVLGTPNEVLTMKEAIPIPAEAPPGGIAYEYKLLGEPFKEDHWLRGTEVRPGDRGVVHHVLLFARPPHAKPLNPKRPLETQLFDWVNPNDPDVIGNGLIGAYVPGELPVLAPPGSAIKLPKGTQLILELHYTPNGRKTQDRTSVGFFYAADKPTREVRSRSIVNFEFVIPPLEPKHPVKAVTQYDKPAVLLSLSPHMHLRGKDFEYAIVAPDGKREVILKVPRYDFNWQTKYVLSEPRKMPKGTRIECLAHFDNSRGNPNNPNPWKLVGWGNQTWEEMMIGFVDYYYGE